MLHRWNDWQVSALLLAHHFLFFSTYPPKPLGSFSSFLNGPTSYFLFSQLADRCRRQVTRSMWMCHSSCWLLYMDGPRICMRLWGTSTRSHSHKVAISLSLFLSRLFCCYCVVLASSRIFWEDVHIYFGWMYRMMSTHTLLFRPVFPAPLPLPNGGITFFSFLQYSWSFFSFKRREEEEEEG